MTNPFPLLQGDGIQVLIDDSNEVFLVVDGRPYVLNRRKARLEHYPGNPAADPWHAPIREVVFEETGQPLRYTRH